MVQPIGWHVSYVACRGPQVQWPCPENLSNYAQTGVTKVR
jgi:hypothetical protein